MRPHPDSNYRDVACVDVFECQIRSCSSSDLRDLYRSPKWRPTIAPGPGIDLSEVRIEECRETVRAEVIHKIAEFSDPGP